jgi:hypothetical protein
MKSLDIKELCGMLLIVNILYCNVLYCNLLGTAEGFSSKKIDFFFNVIVIAVRVLPH